MGAVLGRGEGLFRSLPEGKEKAVTEPLSVIWFKRDLRVMDHLPLTVGAETGRVLLLYMIEPEMIRASDFDPMHWTFIREALEDLQQSLKNRGACLQIVEGEAVEILESLYQKYSFSQLLAHEETGNALSFSRDQRVRAWAKHKGVSFREFPQNGVVRGLKNRDGWSGVWEERMSEAPCRPPYKLTGVGGSMKLHFPSLEHLKCKTTPRDVRVKGGESRALELLESFISSRGHRYHKEMSSPLTAYDSCSRLSPYIAWGCISLRTVVQRVRNAAGEEMPKVAARSFLSRCHWHCHFIQKLESEPEIEYRAFNPLCEGLRKDGNSRELLAAWKTGKTGYPFVDACMRSLKSRGWINFRMRAMLVSFASYHLWLEWTVFRDWLACQFIDYEPGIHFSQIQMQSGLTGINTLRIYNPVKQGLDHDPEGDFIRKWVPELSRIQSELVHTPWKLTQAAQLTYGCKMGKDYPLPIVDHLQAVRHARATFSELRKNDAFWEASEQVMQKHGSRKSGARRGRPKRTKPQKTNQLELNI